MSRQRREDNNYQDHVVECLLKIHAEQASQREQLNELSSQVEKLRLEVFQKIDALQVSISALCRNGPVTHMTNGNPGKLIIVMFVGHSIVLKGFV